MGRLIIVINVVVGADVVKVVKLVVGTGLLVTIVKDGDEVIGATVVVEVIIVVRLVLIVVGATVVVSIAMLEDRVGGVGVIILVVIDVVGVVVANGV